MRIRPPALILFIFLVVFQAAVITRAPFLYVPLAILFGAALIALAVDLVRAPARTRAAVLAAIALAVLFRLPFLLHADGLITTSDNALDALQAAGIRDDRVVPFFLLDAVRHMGTVKYLAAAFVWEATGPGYLGFTLVQLGFCIGVILLLFHILRPAAPWSVLAVVCGLNFAFIETAFDYSLSIRAGSYIEMLFFFLAGVALFDFEFRNPLRLGLAYVFAFFSIYLHPLAAPFVAAFIACTVLMSLRRRVFIRNLAAIAAGAALGLTHWFYYLAFAPKPPEGGGWEAMTVRLPSLTAGFFGSFARVFRDAFLNVFRFEFDYLRGFFPSVPYRDAALAVKTAAVAVFAAVLAAGLVLAALRVAAVVRRRAALDRSNWSHLFALLLFGSFCAKCALLDPPRTEPRHNFDLIVVIVLCTVFVAAALVRARPLLSPANLAVAGLALLFAFPHYAYYLTQARDKDARHRELLHLLAEQKVRALTSDFILVYPIYFLSGRRVRVSDSIGPFTIRNFYPDMRAEVDALPADRKAYLFYRNEFYQTEEHRKFSEFVRVRTAQELQKAGIEYQTFRTRDLVLFVPRRGHAHD